MRTICAWLILMVGGFVDNMSDKMDKFGIPLVEMARLGDFGQYSFWVYTEPLKNRSFHLKHKTDFEIVIQEKDYSILEVKFNNSKFSFTKGHLPPKQILDVIVEFMKMKNLKDHTKTNSGAFDFAWKLLNE